MPQRIAYMTGEYPRATDTFIQREVAELRRAGVSVETISIRRTDPKHHVGPEQREEFARTHYLLPASPWKLVSAHVRAAFASPGRYLRAMGLAWRTRQPGFRGHVYQLFYFLEAGMVTAIFRTHRIEHLHNHFGNSSCSVAMLASVMSGVPFSYTMHGPAIFYEPMLWRIDEKIARASFVACISHFCRSQGMTFSRPEHWHKLRIVHCGVDPDLFELRSHAGRGTRLTYVGRLAAVKGLPVLLEAMAALPTDVRLSVVGDGEDRALLEAMTGKLGLKDRVDFLGFRSQTQVREQLAATDVFVMSSFAEGVPVVLMEAMATGVPVVATRIAGIAELVGDGVSGLLVSPGDTAALVAALERLIADAPLRARLGAAGREMVQREFDGRVEAAWLRAIFAGQTQPGQLRPGVCAVESAPAVEVRAASTPVMTR